MSTPKLQCSVCGSFYDLGTFRRFKVWENGKRLRDIYKCRSCVKVIVSLNAEQQINDKIEVTP